MPKTPVNFTNNLKPVDKVNVRPITVTTLKQPLTTTASSPFKTPTSIASSTVIPSTKAPCATQVAGAPPITVTVKRRIDSMSDEEILQENLKELEDRKNREERKANGRLIAVIVAFMVIFLAIYHAWMRKSTLLAGVLVPAVIMLSYGGWVVLLTRRDKRKRALFEKHLEAVALRNKAELEENFKKAKAHSTKLHYEHEKPNGPVRDGPAAASNGVAEPRRHRKHRRARRTVNTEAGVGAGDSSGSSQHSTRTHGGGTGARLKRPSIRQKLLKQHPHINNMFHPQAAKATNTTSVEERRKRLQRMDTLCLPPLVRMSSAPS